MTTINSLSNPKIKEIVRLSKAHERRTNGLFIIDGQREIELAKEAGWEIQEIFYCPALVKKTGEKIISSKTILTEVSTPVFHKICYKEHPDGFLALAKQRQLALSSLKLSTKPLVVILESVEKPGNLGAIIRTAVAAGVEAIIINDNQTDLFNFNVIRASEGLIFQQPIIQASFAETQIWLKTNNIKTLASATTGKKIYHRVKMTGPTALVFGSEAKGLSQTWLETATELIKIPMKRSVDSLNVSVSAAILIYEALRQRE